MLNDFHYPLVLLKELYDITMDTDRYEEIALVCYREIGNKNAKIERFIDNIDREDGSITLPCEIGEDDIEAVLYLPENWNYVTNYSDNGDIATAWVESYIEARKFNRSPLYAGGIYAKYELVGNKMYFDRPFGPICVLYHNEDLDNEELPKLTNKEAVAIADWCAYVAKNKEFFRTASQAAQALAQIAYNNYIKHIDAARVPEHISQNDWDAVLDAKTSWNRKRHNYSYKPVR